MVETMVERNTSQKPTPPDYLKTYKQHLKKERERYKKIPISEYFTGVINGKYTPIRNSPELIYKAMTQDQPPYPSKAGFMEYPVFSKRDDEFNILGIPRSVESFMRYILAESELNTRDRMVVLVAPTGAGKSTFIKVPEIALERYTSKTEPPPVYGIVGCPINEDPLHALDDETREVWNKDYGIEINDYLCPTCHLKAEESLYGAFGLREQALAATMPISFEVHAIPFSAKLGRGITSIDPSTIVFGQSALIQKIFLGSSRGILRFKEFGQIVEQAPHFLRSINDLIRGRHCPVDGQTYTLDNLMIADMTREEWDKFKGNPMNASLVERLDVIYTTYVLDPIAELKIVQKRIATSHLTVHPHFSPNTLEGITEWAVRTRYRSAPTNKIPEDKKALLYAGYDLEGLTQREHRKKIEEEGKQCKEGLVGISPPALWKVISKLIGEEVAKVKEEGEIGCVDFVELRQRILDHVENQTSTFSTEDRTHMKNQLESMVKEYDTWLIKTVEQAFQDNYLERVNKKLQIYCDNVQAYVTKTKITDPVTLEEWEPDEGLMRKTEEPMAITENAKKAHRDSFSIFQGSFSRQNNKLPGLEDYFLKYPKLEASIKDQLSILTDEQKKAIGTPQEMLTNKTPNAAQIEELGKMEKRLIGEYGFCACCAPRLVDYVRRKIR